MEAAFAENFTFSFSLQFSSARMQVIIFVVLALAWARFSFFAYSTFPLDALIRIAQSEPSW